MLYEKVYSSYPRKIKTEENYSKIRCEETHQCEKSKVYIIMDQRILFININGHVVIASAI